jgi:hypothetical protein
MSKGKDKKYKYPCLYYIPKEKATTFRWSSTKSRGHFGIPKVIFPSGVWRSVDCIVDSTGEYGMTQWCSAIVDDIAVLPLIYKAIRSDRFIELNNAICLSKTELNWKILSQFRKDFWKEFVDEEGNEI